MPITLSQVQTQLTAAWNAINLGERSYQTPGGDQVVFHSLDEFQRHIDWLRKLEADLTSQAALTAGNESAPVGVFQEPSS